MSFFFKNFGLFLSALVVSLVLLAPESRLNLALLLREDARYVLATLPFDSQNDHYQVVKLRKGTHIIVEIYKVDPKSMDNKIYSSFEIPRSKDIFYDTKSAVSNLFIANIDGDQQNEIVIPVLDQNLDSRLSVIKYEPQSKNFSMF